MNVLLVAIGSHGDVHPFVGIGLGLQARGHRVKVIANPYFEPLIRGVGLELVPLGTAEEYRSLAGNPAIWRRIGGTRTIMSAISSLIRPVYRAVAENIVLGKTMLVASTLALGARVAQEQLRLPGATVHLQPSIFRSVTEPPVLPGLFLPPWMPGWGRRAQFRVVDAIIDSVLAQELNEFRRELGLPRVKRILRDYIHSPQRVIGLFPEWFAPPAPDWPQQVRLTGFPLYDERGISKLPEELLRFLDDGDPPIAFTPGSAMWNAHQFLEESAKACHILNVRGLLLTRHRDHLPRSLPSNVRHVEYAPFSELLPQCASLVHHGGIGTSAQALAAGVPQLVMPNAHDQPDNAQRLLRLGVARKIEPKAYRAVHVSRELAELLGNTSYREAGGRVAQRFNGTDPIAQTCQVIEELSNLARPSSRT